MLVTYSYFKATIGSTLIALRAGIAAAARARTTTNTAVAAKMSGSMKRVRCLEGTFPIISLIGTWQKIRMAVDKNGLRILGSGEKAGSP